MVKAFLFLITSYFVIGCYEKNDDFFKNVNKYDKTKFYETSKIVVFYDSFELNGLCKDCKTFKLTNEDFLSIDKIVHQSVFDNNSVFTDTNDSLLTNDSIEIILKDYRRQYIPFIDEFGNKKVWVNCLCDVLSSKWKKEVIIVKDGGSCYFNVIINLSKKKYSEFYVNGNA